MKHLLDQIADILEDATEGSVQYSYRSRADRGTVNVKFIMPYSRPTDDWKSVYRKIRRLLGRNYHELRMASPVFSGWEDFDQTHHHEYHLIFQ